MSFTDLVLHFWIALFHLCFSLQQKWEGFSKHPQRGGVCHPPFSVKDFKHFHTMLVMDLHLYLLLCAKQMTATLIDFMVRKEKGVPSLNKITSTCTINSCQSEEVYENATFSFASFFMSPVLFQTILCQWPTAYSVTPVMIHCLLCVIRQYSVWTGRTAALVELVSPCDHFMPKNILLPLRSPTASVWNDCKNFGLTMILSFTANNGKTFHALGCASANLCEVPARLRFLKKVTFFQPPKCCGSSFCNSDQTSNYNNTFCFYHTTALLFRSMSLRHVATIEDTEVITSVFLKSWLRPWLISIVF